MRRRLLVKQASPDTAELKHWAAKAGWLGAGVAVGSLGLLAASRWLLASWVRRATRIVMTDDYNENLLELFSAVKRTGVQNIGELNLRASSGDVIERPLGTPKKFPDFSGLMFNMAQLATLPTPDEVPIAMSVAIGPQAAQPLYIDLPIIVSGMAYGWALSEAARLALAMGASQAGTALPFLPSERKLAQKLIYQYHRGHWTKDADVISQADAVEIQIGQGASAGAGMLLQPSCLDARLRQQFGVGPRQAVVSHARQPQVQRTADLAPLVDELRRITKGVPIGVKLGAGQDLEADLETAVQAGVDFITIDGAAAATRGSAPILQDDFGLPTLYALVRASRWLQQAQMRQRLSLVVSGGLRTPGDFLKAIALGADAVAIGTMALFAINHAQVLPALPYEPPTQTVWYRGNSSARYDAKVGGESLGNYLSSCSAEMAAGVRTLGLFSLSAVDKRCLFALDPATAAICDVPLGYES